MTFEFKARQKMDGDDYCLEIDEYRRGNAFGPDRMHLIHFRAHKWTPRVLRRALREWAIFRTKFTEDLYATAQVETPAWHKFVTRFGFTPLIDVLTMNGEHRLMYIHRTHDGLIIPTNTIHNDCVAVGCPNPLSTAGVPGRLIGPQHSAEQRHQS